MESNLLPSKTLYLNNINEKIKKDVMKKMLYMVFSQYGKVKDIIACKGVKLRGQAWITFDDVSSATSALRGKQGFNFYDKPLRIAFAKEVSKRTESKKIGEAIDNNTKRKHSNNDGEEDETNTKRIATSSTTEVVCCTLMAKDLPANCNSQMLTVLFQQCQGFVVVRMPPGDKGVAFVDFENSISGNIALKQLDGFQLNATETLQLSVSS